MKTFYSELIADVNAQMPVGKKWVDSSYGNDACGSVMFDPSEKYEDNFVQLFAFETQAEAEAESFGQFGIVVCKDGETVDHVAAGVGNLTRSEAIDAAIKQAKKLIENTPTMPDGFELNTQLGGNCSGWEKACFNKLDARILITCEDGGNAPESFPVLVGIYTEDTEEYFECSTQEELKKIISTNSLNDMAAE